MNVWQADDSNLYGRATGLKERGKFSSFREAVRVAAADLSRERDPFFEKLVDSWPQLFPDSPIRPGRIEGGIVFLYVRSAAALFAARPRLKAIRERLLTLEGAPRKLVLRLEARAT